jgi:hypothetical protein
MAWIESHQTLSHHPKTLRLAGALKCGVPAAIGYVHLLWYWGLDYARDGDIDGSMRDQVAAACYWRGKPEQFWMGLLQSGFVEATDGGVRIHDWMDYAGRLLDRRAQHAARSKRARDAQRDETGRAPGAATNSARVTNRTVPNQPDPPNPHDADAHGGSAPRVGSLKPEDREPLVVHADAGVCPLCRHTYRGSYLEHTAEAHKVRAEPANLGRSPLAPPPELEAQFAAMHERLQAIPDVP